MSTKPPLLRRRCPRRALTCAGLILGLALPPAARAHGDRDARLAAVSRKIAAAPRDAALYLARGELRRVRREWTQALSDYGRAAALDPRMTAVDLCRATLWLDAGLPGRARPLLERFLRTAPHHAAARLALARAHAETGRAGDAARELSRAIADDRDPRPELYLAHAALLEAGSGGREEALGALDRGVARLGSIVTLELAAVALELDLGRTDGALARIARIEAQSDRKEPWTLRRGEILERAGRCEDARRLYAAALARLAPSGAPERGPDAAAANVLETRLRALPSGEAR